MINRWFWSLYALCYDVLNSFGPYQKMMAEIKKRLQLQSGVDYKILDAACGTGNLEVLLKKDKDLSLDITAIDFSPFMLNRAKKKLKNVEGINFLSCDLSKPLPFSDSTFDRIVTVNAFHFLPSPQEVIAEFFRVLKPGGILVLTALKSDHNPILVLKSVKNENDSDEKWRVKNLFSWFHLIFKSIGFNCTAFRFILLAIFNKILDNNVKGFVRDDLEIIFMNSGLSAFDGQLIYGNQNFLYSLKKSNDFFIKKVENEDEYQGMVNIRKEVFIEEYHLPFDENDLDDRDEYSTHFIFYSGFNKSFVKVGTVRFISFSDLFFKRWPISFPAELDLSNSLEISKLCFLKIARDKKNLILLLDFIIFSLFFTFILL